MLLLSALIVISALPALISGSQIPIVNQVTGGGPHPNDGTFRAAKEASANSAPARTPGKLRVVENSGVCGAVILYEPSACYIDSWAETTKGVYQASGYGDLASDKSIWFVLHLKRSLCLFYQCSTDRFWFFAARKNPDTAPLITWFNGGVSDPLR